MKKKYGVSILLAWLTAMVISLSGAYADGVSMLDVLGREMYGISFDKFIIFIGLAIFYEKSWDTFRKSRSWITHLIAVIFSACMLIGISYSVQGSWAFIMGSKYQIVIAAFSFAGYFILFLMYAEIIFLYYFNDMKGCVLTGLAFCLITMTGSMISSHFTEIWYGAGLVAGSFAGWTVAYRRLQWMEKHLDIHIFCNGHLLKKKKGDCPSPKVFDRYEQ